MIRKARIKLTLLYSAIFLLLFWSVSFGIYEWMNYYLGDESRTLHIVQTHRDETFDFPGFHREQHADLVIDELQNILLMIDIILLITIPAITWFLTGNALDPVQKAHKREQQFLTDASHELRTPLSILSAEMEVALKKKRNVTEYQQVIQSGKEEVDELIAIVENLLFLSREKSKQGNPINEQIDITDLLVERIASIQQKVKGKKLKLILQPPKKAITLLGNHQLLKRLFTNLLDNAIKYTEKGSITVTAYQEKQQVLIQITDTGKGIPFEQQENIFDRFYRVEESRSEPGFGLGLAIAKQIMELHQGTITVKSIPEKGTTITLSFPLMIKQNQEKSLS